MPECSSPPAITVGSRLFHVGAPDIPEGTVLSDPYFGSRELNRPVLSRESRQGDDLKAYFNLGPLAEQTFDLSAPRKVLCLDGVHGPGVLSELVWEVVRLREFPDRPSRLDCMFSWQTESEARHWLSFRTWPSALYEVEVIEHRASFLTDLNRLELSPEVVTVTGMMDQGRKYWAGTPGSNSGEVLLEGRVRVIRRLDERRPVGIHTA